MNMMLFKYFKIEKRHSGLPLPDPCGPLNQQLSSINKEQTVEILCGTWPTISPLILMATA